MSEYDLIRKLMHSFPALNSNSRHDPALKMKIRKKLTDGADLVQDDSKTPTVNK